MSQITVYKRNHLSERVLHYPGHVIERGPTWVCLRAVFERGLTDLGFVAFHPGDQLIEWFFTDRWYNIFQIHDGTSTRIKGWYCNITRPAIITATTVEADDLELDLFVKPNGMLLLLDEKEFNALELSTSERIATLRAVEAIRRSVNGREHPFDLIRPDAS